jgi:DNA-binding response OmpR family regulator
MTRTDTSGAHSSSSSRPGTIERELVGVQVLAVDGDAQVRDGITRLLAGIGIHVTAIADGDRALAAVQRDFFSVVLIDLDSPTPGAGLATIGAIKAASPSSMIVAMTPRRSFDDSVAAIRAGAVDIVLKEPQSVEYLQERVRIAAGRSQGKREVDSLLDEVRAVHEEFLQRFMESERRAIDAADQAAGRGVGYTPDLEELRVLIADEVDAMAEGLVAAAPPGYVFVHATSGGEALDRLSTAPFHYAMVAEDLVDLPVSTLVRTIRTQFPETVVLTFLGPAENGKVELVETHRSRVIVQPFREVSQVVARLDELAQAWRAKARERRYTQAFRERHFDFLRRYVEIKTKVDRALVDVAAP